MNNYFLVGNFFPLKTIQLSSAKPNVNIGAVRRLLFSSAGCCSSTILHFGLSLDLGK